MLRSLLRISLLLTAAVIGSLIYLYAWSSFQDSTAAQGAANETATAQSLIADTELLVKQAVALREQFPTGMDADTLKACAAKAAPIREKGKLLMQQVRNSELPYEVRYPLTLAVDNAFACAYCDNDGAACQIAMDELANAKGVWSYNSMITIKK